MRILLTNDDGINAPGLQSLERIARTITDDVWIIAPEFEQSGAGHSRTLQAPLRLRQISEKRFAVHGTPTDCVVMAANEVMRDCKPDLVLSGVNYGANLAEGITTSGTVAAAMEATLFGFPAIAISQVVDTHGTHARWETAENVAPGLLSQLLHQRFPENVLLNINIPDIEASAIKGVRITTQAQRQNEENLEERIDPRGKKYYWIGLLNFNHSDNDNSDVGAINNHYVSVTPLCLNLTHHDTVKHLKNVFN